MKENEDKYLDDFTKKIIKKASLESPSIHFTSEIYNCMYSIEHLS